MAAVNLCIFVGNLGRDPETRYMSDGGDAITNISIGVSESWKDKNGERKEATEWVRVVFFGKLADIVGEHCKKGDSVYVEGKMKTRKWQDKDGVDKYTTEIVGNKIQFLGGGKGGAQTSSDKPSAKQEPQQKSGSFDDDDIPF